MKVQTGNTVLWKFINYLYLTVMAVIIIALMLVFEGLTYDEVDVIDEIAVQNQIMADYIDPTTIFYGILIDFIADINDWVIEWIINKRNFRFRQDHFDVLYSQQFLF